VSAEDVALLAAVLSFIGSLVAGGVAATAVLTSSRSSRSALESQRQLASQTLAFQDRASRLPTIWERRVAVYEDAMKWSRPLLRSLRGENTDRSPVEPPQVFMEGDGIPVTLDAMLRLYAGGDVLAVADALREKFSRTRDLVEALERLEAQLRHDIDHLAWRLPTSPDFPIHGP
jgi:hypothetical protein